jgi:colicin import membrane protein
MSDTMELAVVNAQNSVQIFTQGGLSAILDGIEAQVRAKSLDGSTASGRDEIRSLAYKVTRTKTALDSEAKKLTEGWRTATTQVNAERKRAQERLDALAEEVRAPLTEFENREKNRIAGHQAALAEIGAFASLAPEASAVAIEAALEWLSAIHADRKWDEFVDVAKMDRARITQVLSERLAARRKSDADEAELARLRKEDAERKQAEHEQRIKTEAAEKARVEAERAAKEARDAEARRVIEAAEREQARVKAEAEKVRVENERVQREAEAARQAEEDARKLAEKRAADAETLRVKAEADARAAQEKATADLKAAQEKAKRDTEAALARQREKAERERKAAEDARLKREADENLQAKIRAEISHDLSGETAIPLPAQTLAALVDAIMAGRVRHVKVVF